MPRPDDNRLRPHPQARFATHADVFDLELAAQTLLSEANGGQHGHRQITLFRHGPATLALYCFEAGSRLPDHVVDGAVIIQVLEGRLLVHIDDAKHDLTAGRVLRLGPNVKHDVQAVEPSRMLLTVCVEGPGSHSVSG